MAVAFCGMQEGGGGGSVQMPPANNKACCRYQNTLGFDLTITTMTGIYGAGLTGAGNIKGVVYSDNAGVPDALLQVTNAEASTSALTVFTFPTPWVWTSGTFLWLGFIADTMFASALGMAANVANAVLFNADPYVSGPSNPFGAFSMANFYYRVYASGYDNQFKLGRVSTDDGRDVGHAVGQYFKWDPHFDKFTLGGDSASLAGSTNAVVTSIWVFYTNTNAIANAHCALYNADGGNPFVPIACTLVGVTNDVLGVVPGWNEYTFPTPLIVPAGDYWLGICTDDDTVFCNVCSQEQFLSTAGGTGASVTFYTFPTPIPTAGPVYPFLFDQHPFGISIYAEYTPQVAPSGREIRGAF